MLNVPHAAKHLRAFDRPQPGHLVIEIETDAARAAEDDGGVSRVTVAQLRNQVLDRRSESLGGRRQRRPVHPTLVLAEQGRKQEGADGAGGDRRQQIRDIGQVIPPTRNGITPEPNSGGCHRHRRHRQGGRRAQRVDALQPRPGGDRRAEQQTRLRGPRLLHLPAKEVDPANDLGLAKQHPAHQADEPPSPSVPATGPPFPPGTMPPTPPQVTAL